MKHLPFLIFLFLCSCDTLRSVHIEPKFKAGDCVAFADDSFYSGCSGIATEYDYWTYVQGSEKPDPIYKVEYSCGHGLFVTAKGSVSVKESTLRECK